MVILVRVVVPSGLFSGRGEVLIFVELGENGRVVWLVCVIAPSRANGISLQPTRNS